MEKTKIDGSVLRGAPVLPDDGLYGRTVYIAKNFAFDSKNPSKFTKFGLCSGVIIDELYVLTAAHCTDHINQSRVIFTDDVNKPLILNQVYKVKDLRIPKAYKDSLANEHHKKLIKGPKSRSHRYDLAVLRLDRPIQKAKFSKSYLQDMNSLSYFTSHEKEITNVKAYVAGYGRISEFNRINEDPRLTAQINDKENFSVNGKLLKAKLRLRLPELAARTILRSQRFSTGVCSGDSGAPLFTVRANEFYLQGIAIATYKVRMEDPTAIYNACYGDSIYLNLDYLKDWISEAIRIMNKSTEQKN